MAEKVGELLTDVKGREILLSIHRDGPKRFNQLSKKLNITDGCLNYHLLKLKSKNYIQKDDDGSYSLTEQSQKIIPIVERVLEETSEL